MGNGLIIRKYWPPKAGEGEDLIGCQVEGIIQRSKENT